MLTDLIPAAAEFEGPDWLRARRSEAARLAGQASVPSSEQEVWRYSRIAELDLPRYRPAPAPAAGEVPVLAPLDGMAAQVVLTNGWLTSSDVSVEGVTVGRLGDGPEGPELAASDDPFVLLNRALAPAPLEIVIGRGVVVAEPIVVRHQLAGTDLLVAPRLVVRAGEGSQATVVETFHSPDDATVVSLPVAELAVARAARLTYLSSQNLGAASWQLGNQISAVEQEATFLSVVAALGGDYARLRSDCRLQGRGATGDLLAIYFGEASQTHDFRTFQDHQAPDTTSNLLFKGAVGGHSRSVYTGLIKVRKEARGTNAFQTNRNIKLSDHAWAESVPNLEIENNDVKCSHASTVGPIDEDQRFYLESRGVPPQVAERLVVAGFFEEVIARVPVPSLTQALRRRIAAKLDRAFLADRSAS